MNVGLIPISAKPYHAGHHALVEVAAHENGTVYLYVSVSDRKRKGEFPILGKDMKRVWTEEIEKILPDNVKVIYGGSPVRHVYEFLEDFEASYITSPSHGKTCTVYSDPQDTTLNYSMENRVAYFPEAYSAGAIRFAAEEEPERFTRGKGTPNISGTAMRKALQEGDSETFAQGLPTGLNAENVFGILCPDQTALRNYIQAIISG